MGDTLELDILKRELATILLGALIDAKKSLKDNPDIKSYWYALGKKSSQRDHDTFYLI